MSKCERCGRTAPTLQLIVHAKDCGTRSSAPTKVRADRLPPPLSFIATDGGSIKPAKPEAPTNSNQCSPELSAEVQRGVNREWTHAKELMDHEMGVKPPAPTECKQCGRKDHEAKDCPFEWMTGDEQTHGPQPPKDAGAKYGWQICDEVQRFVSNSSEMQFVPIAAYEKLERELAEAKADLKILCDNKSDIDLMNHKLRKQSAALVALLQEWYDDDYDGCDLLTRTGEALAKFKETK